MQIEIKQILWEGEGGNDVFFKVLKISNSLE